MESVDPAESIKSYVESQFDSTYLPSLQDFIRIPNLSPLFDPDWNTNGLLQRACDHLKSFADGLEIAGFTSRVFKQPDMTPMLFLTIEPFKITENAKTVLFYSHMDKQPWGEGWDEDKKPDEPVIIGNKLYGRGGADDGYGMYAALLSIKACQDNNLSHPRIYVMVEASEESSEDDLIFYVNKFVEDKVFEYDLDLVVALDSDTIDENTFTSTSSLRGIINFDLTVEAFKDNLHSGYSGIFADTFTVANDLIRRLENKDTYLMLDEFQVEIPDYRIEEAKIVATKLDRAEEFETVKGIKPLPSLTTADKEEARLQTILNFTWKSVLSIIGAKGLPDCNIAGNCLRSSTTLTVSIRTPPTMDCKKMLGRIKEIITTDVPFDYKVTIGREDVAKGWDAKELSPGLVQALEYGVNKSYGNVPLQSGCGGAIPFVAILGEKFPNANFLVTGSSLPDTNAHGPNENLDLLSTKRMIYALALMLSKY